MDSKRCWKCHDNFRKDELIDYCAPGYKTYHSYCKKCLKEQQDFDALKLKIVSIFGNDQKLWPRIMKDRKRIIMKYGYTDNTISDCLDYLYNVLKLKVLSKSLCLVTPTNVEKMKQYKRQQSAAAGQLAAAAAIEIIEKPVSIRENIDEEQEENLDEWFE